MYDCNLSVECSIEIIKIKSNSSKRLVFARVCKMSRKFCCGFRIGVKTSDLDLFVFFSLFIIAATTTAINLNFELIIIRLSSGGIKWKVFDFVYFTVFEIEVGFKYFEEIRKITYSKLSPKVAERSMWNVCVSVSSVCIDSIFYR